MTLTCPGANFTGKAPKLRFYSSGVTGWPLILHTPDTSSYVFLVLSCWYNISHDAMYSWPFNKGYETDGINNNNFIYHHIYLAIIIIINFAEDFNRSFLELRLDLKSPELELELELKSLELELELKLIVSSGIGIGIGIENNGIGIGIELKKWNWPQPCLGLCAACWAHFMCHHKLWLTIREFVNWCRAAISNDKSTWWVPSLFVVFFFFFLIFFFSYL